MHYDSNGALLSTQIEELPAPRTGKVRDIYDLGDSLLMITSDRLSAFDVVMPNGIPDKGKVLTSLSKFWFDFFEWIPNHVITMDVNEYPEILKPYAADLDKRSMIVKKCEPLPVECVARGYLIGSGWKDYQATGSVCGIELREGYQIASKLDEPLYTPAYKAEQGEHDENIDFDKVVELIGEDRANFCRDTTLKLYTTAADFALTKGIIIADTKFEFGMLDGEVILIDEALTCDSSRFWPGESYQEGESPKSYDKQYVRDWLETLDWDKTAPGPELPQDVVECTRKIYLQALEELTGAGL